MVRKKRVVKKAAPKAVGKTCSSGCCSSSCWFWTIISEAGLYFFFYYVLYIMQAEVNMWLASAILLVLVNISFFACPYMRKHYM
jgi:hypothetical protein